MGLADRTTRAPAVAGRFYPGDPDTLRRTVDRLLVTDRPASPALALIAPHAGYVYSGSIAGETWARVKVPRRVILMCPNHTGRGFATALWSGGPWEIPGAQIPVDLDLRNAVLKHCDLLLDRDAHVLEHAIEVHLPFLHGRRPDAMIVPVCLRRLDLSTCLKLGQGLAGAIAAVGGDVLVVASTDMSHYIPVDTARALDQLALERVLALDPEGLHRVVEEHGITMCGFVPTTVALACAIARQARTVDLVHYGNSGETSGDFSQVVGYAGLVIR